MLTVARFINLPTITTLAHNGINEPFPETKGDNDFQVSVLHRHPETFYNKYISHDSQCSYPKNYVYDTNFHFFKYR